MSDFDKARQIEFHETQIEHLARKLDRGEITTREYVEIRDHVQSMMREVMAK